MQSSCCKCHKRNGMQAITVGKNGERAEVDILQYGKYLQNLKQAVALNIAM